MSQPIGSQKAKHIVSRGRVMLPQFSSLDPRQALLGFKRELKHLDGHIVTFGMPRGDAP